MSPAVRLGWMDRDSGVPLARQCELAEVARATWYARQQPVTASSDDLDLMRRLDEEYTRHPFYGSRRMLAFLRRRGYPVNRKRVQRLMRIMGLAGMAPGPATSVPHPDHKVYPYLLRGVVVDHPGQVWSTDITYIRLARGFVYLTAIIDWYSRCVLAWRISNSMDTAFCVDCLQEALRQQRSPEVFNTDQGAQFTSTTFTDVLTKAGVTISMDGRGRALDNIFVERLWRSVKHEDVYLNGYATIAELIVGLTRYFAFYNGERPHQALDNRTPHDVYVTGDGGGASIPDYWKKKEPADPATAQRCSAAIEATATA